MQVSEIFTTKDLQELTKHGSKSFPVAVYKTLLRKNRLGYMQMHWHEEMQFIVVTKGSLNFMVAGISHILEAGNGLFINVNQLHSAKPHSIDSEYICLDVHQSFLSSSPDSITYQKFFSTLLDSKFFSTIPLNKNNETEKTILNIIKELYDINESKKFGYELQMQYLILKVCYLIITNLNLFSTKANLNIISDNTLTKEMISFIHNNYQDKIELQDMADNVNLSKSEFCRLFKKKTNQTPFEYLIYYRINQSAKLLRTTDLTITEVANQIGFNSTSYYIDKFKKQMNCTPKQFKNYETDFFD